MKRAQAIAPTSSLQPRYSLVHPEVGDEILPFGRDEVMIVYSPMGFGVVDRGHDARAHRRFAGGRLAQTR